LNLCVTERQTGTLPRLICTCIVEVNLAVYDLTIAPKEAAPLTAILSAVAIDPTVFDQTIAIVQSPAILGPATPYGTLNN
jgi:hypothetical protein